MTKPSFASLFIPSTLNFQHENRRAARVSNVLTPYHQTKTCGSDETSYRNHNSGTKCWVPGCLCLETLQTLPSRSAHPLPPPPRAVSDAVSFELQAAASPADLPSQPYAAPRDETFTQFMTKPTGKATAKLRTRVRRFGHTLDVT